MPLFQRTFLRQEPEILYPTMIITPDALPRMSSDTYLEYEQDQDLRHELVDGYSLTNHDRLDSPTDISRENPALMIGTHRVV